MTAALIATTPESRFAGILTTWLSRKAPDTVRGYSGDLNAFAAWLGEPSQIAAAGRLLLHGSGNAHELLERYVGAMQDSGLAPNTINRRLAVLRSLVKIAQRAEIVTWTLVAMGVRPEGTRDVTGPTWETFLAVLAAEPRLDLRALLSLLAQRGLRIAEALALEMADVSPDFLRAAVIQKRSRVRVWLDVSPVTAEALRAWVGERGTSRGKLFGFEYSHAHRLVARAGERVGVRLRPHALRHTFATRCSDLGVNASDLQAAGRWADLRTAARYLDKSEERVREVLVRVTADALERAAEGE